MSSWALALTLLLCACGTRSTNLALSREADAGLTTADAASAFRDDAGAVNCGNAPCACSDGLDNDGDGLRDGFDPECTGAADAFEDSFATGAHNEDKLAKCADCFFDANSGSGDDGCRRASSCALDGTSSGGSGQCQSCAVAPTCSDSCGPLVPNGCDCFGCCGVFRGDEVTHVLLGSARCSVETLDDPSACTACIPAADCANPCGTCELCPGRTAADLPPSCAANDGPGFTCEDGPTCRSTADCGPLRYCQQGCCIASGI